MIDHQTPDRRAFIAATEAKIDEERRRRKLARAKRLLGRKHCLHHDSTLHYTRAAIHVPNLAGDHRVTRRELAR